MKIAIWLCENNPVADRVHRIILLAIKEGRAVARKLNCDIASSRSSMMRLSVAFQDNDQGQEERWCCRNLLVDWLLLPPESLSLSFLYKVAIYPASSSDFQVHQVLQVLPDPSPIIYSNPFHHRYSFPFHNSRVYSTTDGKE